MIVRKIPNEYLLLYERLEDILAGLETQSPRRFRKGFLYVDDKVKEFEYGDYLGMNVKSILVSVHTYFNDSLSKGSRDNALIGARSIFDKLPFPELI